MEKKCLVCGVILCKKEKENNFNFRKRKYCSIDCSLKVTAVQKQDFDRKLLSGKIPWNKNTKGVMKRNLGTFKKGNSINLGRIRLDMRGENNPGWKPKITKFCPTCNKQLVLAPWQSKRIWCSEKCRGLGKRGSNSPVYKGEKALGRLRSRIYQIQEYIDWRNAVFKRDNWTCICGKKGDIEAHHIYKFAELLKKYNITTPEQARWCKELYDINNGLTLCKDCHRKTDNYGKQRQKN